MDTDILERRIERCCEHMKEANLDVLILTKPSNMFYLCGDGRLCSYAMITNKGQVAIGVPKTDEADVNQLARADVITGFDDEVGMIHSIAHHFKHFGIIKGVLGLEYTWVTKSMLGMLTHPHGKPEKVTVDDCTHVMSELRIVKEPGEIQLLIQAGKVADEGMRAALDAVKEGITESQVAAAAENAMRQAGAEEFWRTYVACGGRTNLAHGIPTNRKIQGGDLVMIDIHPIVDNYSSDTCRMACIGTPTPEQQDAHDLYQKALEAAFEKAKTGVEMSDLEDAMHGMFNDAGHADHIFGPTIHGVGINFEEAPLPSAHASFHGEKPPLPLEANTVIAIGNCGIYTGPWGVRIEDTIVIGDNGPTILTTVPRELRAI
ncbi:MAG TPA: Xaa-Pro peptidase family protein [Candidatus Lokiarchaeia archaeon]|nr:Xaa-Pro peptidase family protein [Candidatus Lokiarchaeia archaeon]